jgi:hypothetical protein
MHKYSTKDDYMRKKSRKGKQKWEKTYIENGMQLSKF